MLRHSLLLVYRNFKRFKTTFFINLTGLSTGLACTLLIYLWVNDELNIDKYHKNDSRLFQVMEHEHNANGIETNDGTPGLLAEALAAEMPEVEYSVTTSWTDQYTLSVDQRNIKAIGQYVGKDFFKIFSHNLIYGDIEKVLSDKSSIVISRKLATSLFNTTENLVGRAITLQHQKEFLISGIFEDVPSRSSNHFDFVMSFEECKIVSPWVLNWQNNGPSTFVMLRAGADVEQFNKKIKDFVKQKGGEEHLTIFATRFSDNYLYGRYENGVQTGGKIEYVRLFSIIAIFILVIACINFMNLSTARASDRIKEVGIKKTVGAGRTALIVQYMGESILMSLLSIMVAILIVDLCLPEFNEVTGKNLTLDLNAPLIFTFLGFGLFTGLIAGSYPALYLSAFSPSAILKGKLNTNTGELWTRKGLVIFQFAVSVIFIVWILVVYKQIEFIQNADPGYDKDNIIYFDMEGKVEESPETFLSEIKKIPGIVNASSIGHSLVQGGYRSGTSTFDWEGKNENDIVEFDVVRVNYGMMETLDMQMKEGRMFSPAFGSEDTGIILNEAGIDITGLKDPIGKVVRVWGNEKQIVGVVKDFHFQSMHEPVKPLLFLLNPTGTWIIMAKIQAGKEQETINELEQFYKRYNPGFTFSYRFLDDAYQAQYTSEKRVSDLSRYFAGLAILISCLGLFGLAAFTTERRTKEIGIRKVLGSGVLRIVYLLSGDFTKIVLVSIGIALPISYVIARRWLDTFAFNIALEWWYFISAGLIALVIAWITVGMQAFKAARVNPVKCLRDE